MLVERAQVRPYRTTKYEKKIIVGFDAKETFKRGLVINDSARNMIDEIDCRKERFVPKLQWHVGMRKEGETHIHYVPMFSFSGAVLLVSMWTGNMMSNTKLMEKCVAKHFVLSAPVRLDT